MGQSEKRQSARRCGFDDDGLDAHVIRADVWPRRDSLPEPCRARARARMCMDACGGAGGRAGGRASTAVRACVRAHACVACVLASTFLGLALIFCSLGVVGHNYIGHNYIGHNNVTFLGLALIFCSLATCCCASWTRSGSPRCAGVVGHNYIGHD